MKATGCVLALAVMGCAPSLRERADTAYAKGNFVEAADLYDQLASKNPKDPKFVRARDAARDAELRVELAAVQNARSRGLTEEAAAKLASLLERRDGWGGVTSIATGEALAFEETAVSAQVAAAIAARTAEAGPLAGEDAAGHYNAFLAHADLATTRAAVRAQLLDAGRTRCESLAARRDGAYWTWFVGRYCAHFGLPQAVPVLPVQRSALDVDGAVTGEPDAQNDALRTALAAAFRRSAWFAATGPRTAHATVDGQLNVQFSSQPVTLTASWTEQVPYTEYETTQESYQEPYDDTEYYTEEVPSTEYRTETVPCGDTTCTNTVPTTVYHSEQRTRTVTKYRTAWRDVTNPVTRYRDEPRTQDYSAVERSGAYASSLRVRLDRELPEIVATIETDRVDRGYDHDVTIEPAGVSPQRANLRSAAEFAADEQARLADALVAKLNDAYAQQFCSASTFTLDEAARCAYAGSSRLTPAAHATLAQTLGAEEAFVAAVTDDPS